MKLKHLFLTLFCCLTLVKKGVASRQAPVFDIEIFPKSGHEFVILRDDIYLQKCRSQKGKKECLPKLRVGFGELTVNGKYVANGQCTIVKRCTGGEERCIHRVRISPPKGIKDWTKGIGSSESSAIFHAVKTDYNYRAGQLRVYKPKSKLLSNHSFMQIDLGPWVNVGCGYDSDTTGVYKRALYQITEANGDGLTLTTAVNCSRVYGVSKRVVKLTCKLPLKK